MSLAPHQQAELNGSSYCWWHYFISTTFFVIPALYFMWSRTKKHHPEFEHIEEYEKAAQ
jgi:hypothetical protein